MGAGGDNAVPRLCDVGLRTQPEGDVRGILGALGELCLHLLYAVYTADCDNTGFEILLAVLEVQDTVFLLFWRERDAHSILELVHDKRNGDESLCADGDDSRILHIRCGRLVFRQDKDRQEAVSVAAYFEKISQKQT